MLGIRPFALLSFAALALCGAGHAATELSEIHLSADIHFRLPVDSSTVLVGNDDSIAVYDIASGFAEGFAFLGTLDAADLNAYHDNDACGAALYSLDATAEISGTVMRPADVFQEAGQKVLDGIVEGITDGVGINAVTRDPSTCDLVVSFDTTVQLDGTVFRPSDLARFSGGVFSLFRAGPPNANLDAVHLLETGSVLASFSAPVPGLGFAFADEDIVEQDEAGGAWELAFQPAAVDASWQPADTNALFAVRAPPPEDFLFSDRFESVP